MKTYKDRKYQKNSKRIKDMFGKTKKVIDTSVSWEKLKDKINQRKNFWAGGQHIDLTFMGLEVGEEAGELQGALKKIIRDNKGIAGNKVGREKLEANLKHEIGDVIICIARIAEELNIDVDDCIKVAFNQKSDQLGLEVKI